MRNGLLGSIAGVLAGATLCLAQAPLPAGAADPAGADVTPAGGLPSTSNPTVVTVGYGAPAPVVLGGGCASCGGGGGFAGNPAGGPGCGGIACPGCLNQPDLPSPYISHPCRGAGGCPGCGGAGPAGNPVGGPGCGGIRCPGCLSQPDLPSPYVSHACPAPPPAAVKVPCGDKECEPHLVVNVEVDYLNWWVKNGNLSVPLVTTAPGVNTAAIGGPGTTILLGTRGLDYGNFSGARIVADFWHDESRCAGVEAGVFGLIHRTTSFHAASDPNGNPTLAVPFRDAIDGTERVSLVSFPGAFAGTVSFSSGLDLIGAEGNALWQVPSTEGGRNGGGVWLLGGLRFLDLRENIELTQRSDILPGGVVPVAGGGVALLQGGIAGPPPGLLAPNTVQVKDLFRTQNELYAAQLGFKAEAQRGDAFVVLTGKIALGINHEILKIDGQTAFSPGGPNNSPIGGLFAVASNSGRHSRNSFAAVPEVGVQAGYYLTPNIRGHVGYDFLYWTDALRPGEQIDRVVNRALVPTSSLFGGVGGPSRPLVPFKETEFWAHGVNVGLDFTY